MLPADDRLFGAENAVEVSGFVLWVSSGDLLWPVGLLWL